MGSLEPSHWALVLVVLLQLQSVKVQGVDPVSQRLRRLSEQFQQFQALTQTRLDMLALNQNRESSRGLERRVQALSDHHHHVSQELKRLKQSTAQEIEGLRQWSRKLEKKSKRMEGRVVLMERNLRETRRQTQEEKPDLRQDVSNLTVELQGQEDRLAALQAQRHELLLGLKELQESLKIQALRVTRVEEGGNVQTHGGGRRILRGRNQPRADEISPSQARSHQDHAANQPKAQKPRPQIQNSTSQETDYLPRSQAQTREPAKDREISTRPEAPEPLVSHVLPLPQSEPHQSRAGRWKGEEEEEEEDEEEAETSVIHNILHLPARHKIPERPVRKKEATICNVDSMLLFPSASVENYVTFSLTLPHLPELSVCLWLRVEASRVGTLLSYATEDNDNQLVLYGRNAPASSTSLSSSSSSSRPSYSSSPPSSHSASSLSLDFVIGDPFYRRLPVSSLLDARWHHLCVLWSSIQGRFWHYSNRRLVSSGANFRKGWEIPGGGSLVLGQEQDSVGGGFDPAEGFDGQMAGFRVWNRVLSPLEVEGVAEGRGVPRGVVLDMEDIEEVHGEVQQMACECLEHCVG